MKKDIYQKYAVLIILGIDIAFLLFRLYDALYGSTSLNSEEAQYWLWSKHPAWSYYSKPPLIAWTNYLSTKVFGDTIIGIRINAILIGFILPLIHYALAKRLFNSRKTAFWSSLVLFVLPHYHYITKIFTTDTLVLLFWSLNMLLCVNAVQKDKLKYWIFSGIALGLGIISKYTMLLWVPVFLLISFMQKKNLLKIRGFYLSLLIAFLICSPVLFWNILQEFVGAKHILGLMGVYNAHGNWHRSIGRIFEFLGGQLLCISPFFLPAFYTICKKWKNKELSHHYGAVHFLLVPLLFVWLFFLILSIQKNEVNWTFFAFTSLPILLGYSLVRFFNIKHRLLYIGITGILVFMVQEEPRIFDNLGLTKLYPPQIDMYSRQAGWDELGENVTGVLKGTDSDRIFIFSDSYHISSVLSFYVKGNPQTYCVNTGRRMNQFDIWPGIDQFENRNYDAIYVSKNPLPPAIINSAETIRLMKTQKRIYRHQEVGKDIRIYYLKNFKAIDETSPTRF